MNILEKLAEKRAIRAQVIAIRDVAAEAVEAIDANLNRLEKLTGTGSLHKSAGDRGSGLDLDADRLDAPLMPPPGSDGL